MHEANSDDDRPSGDKKSRSIIDAESRRQKPPKSFDLPKDLPKDPIEIVDLFETQNAVVEAVQTQSLLNQDDHLDYKKELLKFDDFEDLFRHIESPKEKYFGEVSCTGLFGSYYFVGNSNGYIRVFDLKSELVRDLKPLYDKQLAKKRVMCIDFSLGMEYLVAGYENGSMALFDLQTYKLVKVISDVHETPVLAAKIYLINKVKSSVSFLSMEQSGQVTRTKINTKDFFKKSTKDGLYDKRFKHPRTIAVQHIDDRFVKSKWATRGLVAVGATSEVVVCQMNPLTEIYKLKRPPQCRSTAIPYLDFGVGLTPSNRNKQVQILAVAWDTLIQLIYFDNEITLDGLFFGTSEIRQCQFMGDSVIVILDQQKVKVISTYKLLEGSYQEQYQSLQKIIEFTETAVLDKGLSEEYEVQDLIFQEVEMVGKTKQIVVSNYNNTVVRFGRHMMLYRDSTITKVSLYTHEQFLDKLYYTDSVLWLTQLGAALEIFSNTMTGFSDLSDDPPTRQQQLLPSMKRSLMDILHTIVHLKEDSNDKSYEECIIRTAIEFCLALSAADYLFTDVYEFFDDKYLTQEFIKTLEPFIMTGQLKSLQVPQMIVRKLVYLHEDKGTFDEMEKMITQMDLSAYGDQNLKELEQLCQSKFLGAAVFHIQMSQEKESNKQFSCQRILKTMYKMMRQAKDLESSKRLKNPKLTIIRQEDMQVLLKTDKERKAEIEKSHIYIGYKLLWVMNLFISGRRFPDQALVDLQWRQYCYDIIVFLLDEAESQYLAELLQFDAEVFFDMVTKLFKNRPWKFFTEIHKKLVGGEFYTPQQLVLKLEEKAESQKALVKSGKALDNFYVFVLKVANFQYQKKNSKKRKPFEIEDSTLLRALRNVVTCLSENSINLDESIILGAVRSRPFSSDQIDQLRSLIEEQPERQRFINVQIELYTNYGDYVQAFKCLLQSKSDPQRVFKWVYEHIEYLQPDPGQQDELKKTVKAHLYDLAALEVEFCKRYVEPPRKKTNEEITKQIRDSDLFCKQIIQLIDIYFQDDSECVRQLVTMAFAESAHLQLHFLKTYIVLKEREIRTTVHDAVEQPQLQRMADLYELFLTIFTRRLCELEPENVEDWVSLEYFPTRKCMEICRQWRNFNGEALLMEKLGDGLKGISIYLRFMEQIDQSRMTDQLSALGTQSSDVGRLNHFEHLGRFDQTLEKASRIACKVNEQGKPVYGEDAWFLILEFLHKYKSSQANQPMHLSDAEKEERARKLKSFIMLRIRYVLQRDGMDLSFRRVADRLNLEFEQIENLCKFKLESLIADSKREARACSVQQLDLYHQFKDASTDSTRGSFVKSRYNEQNKHYQCLNICWLCCKYLMNQEAVMPIESFGCGHVYHQQCLKERNTCFACDQRQIIFDEDDFYEYQLMMKQTKSEQVVSEEHRSEMTKMQKQRQTQRALLLLDSTLQDSYLSINEF